MTSTIALTANAGVLLSVSGIKYMVDALHHEGQYPFSKVPLSLLTEMNREDNIFHNADYLIFTHAHPDHYTPQVVLDYLRHNVVHRLLLPRGKEAQEAELVSYADLKSIPVWRLGLPRGKIHTYQLQHDVYLTVMGMRHVSAQFANLDCDCLLLTAAGQNYLFTSDCDFTNSSCFDFLKDIPIECAFINPYFFHDEEGRHLLSNVISPRHVILYHIPFQEEDTLSMRSLVRQDIRKNGLAFMDVKVLENPRQILILN